VLVYSTGALTEDTEVTGPIRAKLFAASSAPIPTSMVKLIDVWPDGFAQRLCDGMVRARFREGMTQPSLIERGEFTPMTLIAGILVSYSRWVIASASKLLRAVSQVQPYLNTADDLGMTANMKIAKQTILHNGEHASYVLLPIFQGRDEARPFLPCQVRVAMELSAPR